MAISTASHNRSTPMPAAMGARMGTTMKQIWRKSRKKPSRKMRSMLAMRKPSVPPGRLVITSSTRWSPPMPRNTRPKAVAPIRIRNTMLVSRVVRRMASFNLSRESCPCRAASSSAPSAPTAADSVGEAIPKNMEPRTPTTSASGGNRVRNTLRARFSSVSAVIAGATSGLSHAYRQMYTRNSATSSIPGTTAPMNRRPTGTPITSPSRIRTILGGMIWPRVPAAAMVPVESCRE